MYFFLFIYSSVKSCSITNEAISADRDNNVNVVKSIFTYWKISMSLLIISSFKIELLKIDKSVRFKLECLNNEKKFIIFLF